MPWSYDEFNVQGHRRITVYKNEDESFIVKVDHLVIDEPDKEMEGYVHNLFAVWYVDNQNVAITGVEFLHETWQHVDHRIAAVLATETLLNSHIIHYKHDGQYSDHVLENINVSHLDTMLEESIDVPESPGMFRLTDVEILD